MHFARKRDDTQDLIDISTSTAQTVALLEYRAKQKRIQITTDLEKNLYLLGNENEFQKMNGQLEIRSVEGQGTVVEITLPKGSYRS